MQLCWKHGCVCECGHSLGTLRTEVVQLSWKPGRVCECGHSLGTLRIVHVVKLETWVSVSVPIALVFCGL